MPDTDRETVTYQFQIDADLWEQWKLTVPRNKTLETRITELVEADLHDELEV